MSTYIQIWGDTNGDFVSYFNQDKAMIKEFGPIDRINIFVGANNSGKSRLMRAIMKKDFFLIGGHAEVHRIIDQIGNLCNDMMGKLSDIDYFHIQLIRSNHTGEFNPDAKSLENLSAFSSEREIMINKEYINNMKESIMGILSSDVEPPRIEDSKQLVTLFHAIFHFLFDTILGRSQWSSEWVKIRHINSMAGMKDEINAIHEKLQKLYESFNFQLIERPTRIYIPVLRGSARLTNTAIREPHNKVTTMSEDIYKSSIYHNYEFKGTHNLEIFTGRNLYDDIKEALLSPRNTKVQFREFEKFVGDTFFNKKIDIGIVEKPTKSGEAYKNHINIYSEGEQDRYIHNLGDGIQSIIILAYKLFMAPKSSWIFIEEPEMNLHPGFQRIFLNLIASNQVIVDKDLTIFFTTHSNHLLDLSSTSKGGISIFAFDKYVEKSTECFEIRTVQNNDLHMLDLLGVNNSSVFMANCSIWVEGITDRKYIKAYLREYCKKKELPDFQEDLDYAFFEYAGSNIEHYLFTNTNMIEDLVTSQKDVIRAQFLSNRIFLLSDKDKDKEYKHSFLFSQTSRNFGYIHTKSREIENLLSPKMLALILPELIRGLNQQQVNNADLKKTEYFQIKLGTYLRDKLQVNIPKSVIDAKGNMGTPFKKRLAVDASEKMTWDLMSTEAKKMIEPIYI